MTFNRGRFMTRICACFLFVLMPAWAQEIKFPASFEKLAAKAVETVDVKLDSSMLKTAGAFLSSKEPDQAKAKKLVSGLKGVYVKSFQFQKQGEYSESDLEAIRSQLKAPEWVQTVKVRSKKDNESVDIYFKKQGDTTTGMVIIAGEPMELTVVNIDGTIDLEQLGELGGQFGIPNVHMEHGAKKLPNSGK